MNRDLNSEGSFDILFSSDNNNMAEMYYYEHKIKNEIEMREKQQINNRKNEIEKTRKQQINNIVPPKSCTV